MRDRLPLERIRSKSASKALELQSYWREQLSHDLPKLDRIVESVAAAVWK
jgi:hypothetical protein